MFIYAYAVLLAASEAEVDRTNLRQSDCPEASGDDSFDDVQLLQKFVLQEVEPRHGGSGISVVAKSKTVQLSMGGGQVMATAQPMLALWPAGGPAWTKSKLFAVQDRTMAVAVVGVTTLAVLMLLCFRVPLPTVRRRRQKAVELPEVEDGTSPTTTMQRQLEMLEDVTQWNWDNANWQGCWAEAMLRKQTQGTTSALPDLPAPVPRLRTIGASYVVPFGCIKSATGTTLSFDIPTLPAVWPLRAVLTRATPQSPWSQIDLTVDVIAAAELPPLLSCTVCSPSGDDAHQKCSETTGGTGSTTAPGSLADADVEPCSQWLAIRNSGGAILASVMPKEKDPTNFTLQRQSHDRMSWDIDVHLEAEEPWVVVSRLGQEIGQATSLGCRRGPPQGEDSDDSEAEDSEEPRQHLQIDTQPETQTPESLLLLMCFLAMVSFQKPQEAALDRGEP